MFCFSQPDKATSKRRSKALAINITILDVHGLPCFGTHCGGGIGDGKKTGELQPSEKLVFGWREIFHLPQRHSD